MPHTSGPWEAVHDGTGIRCSDGRDIARIYMPPGMTPEEHVANSRLVASAPELLAACKALLAFHEQCFTTGFPLECRGNPIDHALLNKAAHHAKAAVAKAEPGFTS